MNGSFFIIKGQKRMKKEELLFSITKKDFVIEYFSGTGAGGQHRNKHQNCVRLKHRDSGVLVTGQSHRERSSNTREAMNNLVSHVKFKMWHAGKVKEILSGETAKERVEKRLSPDKLRIEGKIDGKWCIWEENE